MARLAQHPIPVRPEPANFEMDRRVPKAKANHKVVLESVTQEKKKLRSVLSFKAEPPKGYTYIPAGNPELTNALKEIARKGNHEVYAVSTTPHQRAHDLSKQVHRVGFHFPSTVVAQVCAQYGIVLSSAGTVLAEDEQVFQRRSNRLKERNIRDERKNQTTINTEARDTIKDLFPKMPDNDVNMIIKTAFQIGQGKVGTADELTLIRRAQLAVVAHIRHVYTDYDKLLRQTHYRGARNIVEKATLRKLVEWRGDDEHGKQDLEDVFREVIVISDDEESSEEEDHDLAKTFRDVSVEIVSSNTKTNHLDPEPVVLHEPRASQKPIYLDLTSSRRPPIHQSIHTFTPKQQTRENIKTDRRGFNRYRAWIEARDEYRANPVDVSVAGDRASRSKATESSLHAPTSQIAVRETLQHSIPDSHESYLLKKRSTYLPNIPAGVLRTEDGTLYERSPQHLSSHSRRPVIGPAKFEPRFPDTVNQGRPLPPAPVTYRQLASQPLGSKEDSVLPSIEVSGRPTILSQGPMVRDYHPLTQSSSGRREFATKGIVQGRLNNVEFLDMSDDTQHLPKRRKVNDSGPEMASINSAGKVIRDHSSQQWQTPCLTLLPPTKSAPQSRHSNPISLARYRDVLERQTFPSTRYDKPSSASARSPHDSSWSSTRPLMARDSGVGHLSSRGDVCQPEPSARMGDELTPRHGAGPAVLPKDCHINRGIHEHRAYQARDIPPETPHSAPRWREYPSYKRQDVIGFESQSLPSGSEEVFLASGPSLQHDSTASPSTRLFTLGDDLPRAEDAGLPYHGGLARRDLPRRRSASSVIAEQERVDLLPGLRPPRLERQYEGPRQLDGTWDRRASPREHRGAVFSQPNGRYEQPTPPAQTLSVRPKSRKPRGSDYERYYAQL